MPYSYVLPIAYEINTFTLVQTDVLGAFSTYRGRADSGKDISKRCQIMCNAIDIAYDNCASHAGGRSSESLKVFMAPEFYFRGKEGAYPVEVLSEIMPLLREHTKDIKFADWLFVFGTALGRIETEDGKFEILNVALVQKGGVAAPDGVNERIIYKEYISSIDFAGPNYGRHADWENPVNRRVFVGGGTRAILPVEGSNDPTRPSALDHLLGRLKMTPPAVGNAIVQLHLITSAGASITPAYVSGRTGTVAFNVDGNSRSDVKVKAGPNACNASIAAAGTYDISLRGWAWWTVTHDAYFGEYGRIKVYPRQALRAAETATV